MHCCRGLSIYLQEELVLQQVILGQGSVRAWVTIAAAWVTTAWFTAIILTVLLILIHFMIQAISIIRIRVSSFCCSWFRRNAFGTSCHQSNHQNRDREKAKEQDNPNNKTNKWMRAWRWQHKCQYGCKKVMIDNCLVESSVLDLLILVSRVVFDSIQDKRSVNWTIK